MLAERKSLKAHLDTLTFYVNVAKTSYIFYAKRKFYGKCKIYEKRKIYVVRTGLVKISGMHRSPVQLSAEGAARRTQREELTTETAATAREKVRILVKNTMQKMSCGAKSN